MDTEDQKEWMEENDVRHCSRWSCFTGRYNTEYDFCDVRTGKGELGPCFWNGNSFMLVLSDEEKIIPSTEVISIRYYESSVEDESDDELDDEHERIACFDGYGCARNECSD